MDERFKLHRLYSTRFAVIITSIFIGGWFYYDYFLSDIVRWDLLSILTISAVSKIAAMIYYRKTN